MANANTILKQYPIGKQIILDLFAHGLTRGEPTLSCELPWTVENYYYLVGSRKKEIEAVILSCQRDLIRKEGERLEVQVYGAMRQRYSYLSTTQGGHKIRPGGYYNNTLKLYYRKKSGLDTRDTCVYIHKFMDTSIIPNIVSAGTNMLDVVYENLRRT